MENVVVGHSVRIARIDVSETRRYGSRYRVRPRSDRPTPLEWRYHFFVACEEDPRLKWDAAGFARCRLEELSDVQSALQAAVDDANERFAAKDDRIDADRSRLEPSPAASPTDSYPILFP